MGRTDRVTDSISRVGAIPPSVGQGIYEESVTQKARLGARMDLGDGRVFYYAYNGGVALAAGKTVASAVVHTQREDTLTAAVAIGAKEFTFTDQAIGIAADEFSEGSMVVNAHTGVGQTYKIRGNEAIASGETGTIYLYDPMVVALDTTSDVTIVQNLFRKVIITDTDLMFILGVPLIVVNINYYFWLQTWGPVGVLMDGSTGVATTERILFPHTTTDGALLSTAGGTAGIQRVANHVFNTEDVVSADYELVYLTCLP